MNKWQTASSYATISTELLLDALDEEQLVEIVASDMRKRFSALLSSEGRPTTGAENPNEIFLDDTGVNKVDFMKDKYDPKQQYFKVSIPVNIAEIEANEKNAEKYVNLAEHRVKYLVRAWLEGARAALSHD